MSFSINTNNNALAALETLNNTQQAMTRTQNRVSSGLKVAGAADDASTFAIAQGQRGDIAGFQQVSSSLALGSAVVNVALQGAQSISDTLNLIKAKVVQAQGAATDADAAKIQGDIKSFLTQIDSTVNAASFNGANLISKNAVDDSVLSSLNTVVTAGVAAETADHINVTAQKLDTATLLIAALDVGSVVKAIGAAGDTALGLVNTAIAAVTTSLAALGTSANQLTAQSNFVKSLTDTLTSGVGTLVDADLAAESANLQALQTKQQLGIQALSIANQGPGAILTLFR